MTITATYSPEDNKLRLYASERLDAETYARVKEAGFKWAPKQQLFVAPAWSPQREDLCLELAGEIEPEATSLAERAAMKAERLDALAEKRRHDANAFARAASGYAERFAGGQPILVGHHSERSARKAAERADAAQRKANKCADLVGYWIYRAAGVEAHANYKADPRVRANRIKTLLAELRQFQRTLREAEKRLSFWLRVRDENPDAATLSVLIGRMDYRATGPYEDQTALREGKLTAAEFIARRVAGNERTLESDARRRWIEHTLNRLAYERSELGPVERYTGEMRATLIQMFVREHGADSPKAKKVEGGWRVESPTELPHHIACGKELTLDDNGWRDLMESSGYEPPAPKSEKAPILNFKAPTFSSKSRYHRDKIDTVRQIEMTQAEYAKADPKATRLSVCGRYRFRVTLDHSDKSIPYYSHPWAAVFITDAKTHPAPEADSEAA